MNKVSYRQTFFIGIMSMALTCHVMLISTMIELSNRNAWLIILINSPIGLLYAGILFYIHKLTKRPLFDTITVLFNNFFGKFIHVILFFYFLLMILFTYFMFLEVVHIYFLQDYSAIIIGISLYVVILYTVFLGMKINARAAEAFGILITITGTTIGFFSLFVKDFSLLLPLFDFSLQQYSISTVFHLAMYGELFFILGLSLQKHHPNSHRLIYPILLTVMYMTVIIALPLSGVVAIFGEDLSSNSELPTLSMLSVVSVGFIERVEVYALFTTVIASSIKLCLYHHLIERSFSQIIKIKKRMYLHIFLSLFVLAFFYYLTYPKFEIWRLLTLYIYPSTSIITIGIPLFLLIYIFLKKGSRVKLESNPYIDGDEA